jgi:hypothetical protein
MSLPKLLAFDLDRTLLGPGGTYTPRARAALADARRRGIPLIAAGTVTIRHRLDHAAAAAAAAQLRAAEPRLRIAVETGYEVLAEPGYARPDSVHTRRRNFDSLDAAMAAADAATDQCGPYDQDGVAVAVEELLNPRSRTRTRRLREVE